jgi:peptidoglycan/LPS O-acetylase OafA/YrhL
MGGHSRILALDGVRFLAAFFVAGAHSVVWIVLAQQQATYWTDLVVTLTGLGMTLFFVLSGFVIHYTYHSTWDQPRGAAAFVVARFSRLYPLYFAMLILGITAALRGGWSSCRVHGVPSAIVLALPYYLTLTQDWLYGVICGNNLIYQYHQVLAVSWSISAEVFFYGVYLVGLRWTTRWSPRAYVIAAASAYGLLLLYFLACYALEARIEKIAATAFGPVATLQNGYQDSLLRWLLYFSPPARLVDFLAGVAAAALYMKRRECLSAKTMANAYTVVAVVLLLAVHLWLYGSVAYSSSFIGRTASSLYSPLVAVLVFCIAIYPQSVLSKFFGLSVLVALGDASYSIYLLHALFSDIPRNYFFSLRWNPWLLWALALTALFVISRFTYLCFERPMQRTIRASWRGWRGAKAIASTKDGVAGQTRQ